jgi:periplasmic divalent cation tolerance protein
MKSAPNIAVVLITAPDLKTARALAVAALRARLVACVNLVPRVESHYWWRGKLERGNEVLLVLKTVRHRLSALEKLVLKKHPYESPELIVLPLVSGTVRYLDWLTSSVHHGLNTALT